MKTFLSLLVVLYPLISVSQEKEKIAELQSAMSQEDLNRSKVLFEEQTQALLEQKDYFGLSFYIPFAGRLATMADPDQQGLDEVAQWLQLILNQSAELNAQRQALLETGAYYNDMGQHQQAYATHEKALHITYQMEGHRPSQWATIEGNLGLIAQTMGNLDLAKTHHLKALEGYKEDSTSTAENYFFSNNHMGAISWYASKFDSAEYYFSQCLKNLEGMEPDPVNQYYRKSMIQNNLAGVNDMNGNSRESIRMVKSSIVNLQYFMDNALDDPRRNRAMALMTRSTQNLAGVYKSLGDYRQALGLLEYNLRQREKHFPPLHPEIIESWIVLGQLHHAMKNDVEAIDYLEDALKALQEIEGEYPIKEADAFYTLALVYESQSDPERAREYYLLASGKLEMAMKDTFDYVYLEFLGHAATFFSEHGDPDQAFLLAGKGLDYIASVEGRNSIPGFGQILNMGQVHYNLGNFEKAGGYAREGKAVLEGKMLDAQSAVDSIRISFDLPKAILLEAQSNFELETEKSEAFLSATLKSLKGAITLLEKRKTILSDTEDINLLFAQNKALLEFTKKVLLALHELTGDEDYLNQLIQIQETGVYNKIRAQLSKADQLQFAGVPQSVQVEEESIKKELTEWFENGGELSTYLKLTDRWDQMLENLKSSYPAYYQTRYASLGTDNIELPQENQIVRYFFINDNLYALVIAFGNQKLYPLDFDPALVEKVAENWNNPTDFGQVVHQLYQQIWAPFADKLVKERVVVIPDGPLFNLSFDLLTQKTISTFKEFQTESLLAKHAISYHYSLWLAKSKNTSYLEAPYVAFAPGFDDHLKDKYMEWVTDSKSYETAVP
jgi:tetratricopeptide (TPR) repeat protein